jgi:hypothetical protein
MAKTGHALTRKRFFSHRWAQSFQLQKLTGAGEVAGRFDVGIGWISANRSLTHFESFDPCTSKMDGVLVCGYVAMCSSQRRGPWESFSEGTTKGPRVKQAPQQGPPTGCN